MINSPVALDARPADIRPRPAKLPTDEGEDRGAGPRVRGHDEAADTGMHRLAAQVRHDASRRLAQRDAAGEVDAVE